MLPGVYYLKDGDSRSHLDIAKDHVHNAVVLAHTAHCYILMEQIELVLHYVGWVRGQLHQLLQKFRIKVGNADVLDGACGNEVFECTPAVAPRATAWQVGACLVVVAVGGVQQQHVHVRRPCDISSKLKWVLKTFFWILDSGFEKYFAPSTRERVCKTHLKS